MKPVYLQRSKRIAHLGKENTCVCLRCRLPPIPTASGFAALFLALVPMRFPEPSHGHSITLVCRDDNQRCQKQGMMLTIEE